MHALLSITVLVTVAVSHAQSDTFLLKYSHVASKPTAMEHRSREDLAHQPGQ
ncbi:MULTISPECIES: hypothetical protein [Pseudomonas]|uniref:hypothetical protein n=1 Tax=Pseudomonas TaxID=286 RepID=UPI0012FF6077|nr:MULTISPECIES: hypothetical protein [Pseudomonas]